MTVSLNLRSQSTLRVDLTLRDIVSSASCTCRTSWLPSPAGPGSLPDLLWTLGFACKAGLNSLVSSLEWRGLWGLEGLLHYPLCSPLFTPECCLRCGVCYIGCTVALQVLPKDWDMRHVSRDFGQFKVELPLFLCSVGGTLDLC